MIYWADSANTGQILYGHFETINQSMEASNLTSAGVALLRGGATGILTTGISLSTNVGNRTGIHEISINMATAGLGGGNLYSVYFTSGTVDSKNVTNRIIGSLTVDKYAQAPSGFNSLSITDGAVVASLTGDLTSTMKASINTEVLDVLTVDTFAQSGQGTPPATISLGGAVNYLYKAWRNRKSQTSSEYALYNDDATTVDQKATVTGTTTVVVGEVTTGP